MPWSAELHSRKLANTSKQEHLVLLPSARHSTAIKHSLIHIMESMTWALGTIRDLVHSMQHSWKADAITEKKKKKSLRVSSNWLKFRCKCFEQLGWLCLPLGLCPCASSAERFPWVLLHRCEVSWSLCSAVAEKGPVVVQATMTLVPCWCPSLQPFLSCICGPGVLLLNHFVLHLHTGDSSRDKSSSSYMVSSGLLPTF